MSAQNQPTVFNDDLSLRATGIRFRNVGNPYHFLNEIGIVPIKEFLFRGANIIDIADTLNLPLTIIHNWIAENNYGPEIEEASVISAEGYIHQGERLLKAASTKFDLDKAKALLEHGRFMASKKNKKLYGTQVDVAAGPAAVQYVFNIGAAPPQTYTPAPTQAEDAAILEAEYHMVPKVSLQLTDDGVLQTPEGLVIHDDTMEFLGALPEYLKTQAGDIPAPTIVPIESTDPEPEIPAHKPPELLRHFPVNKDKPTTTPVPPPVEHSVILAEKDTWRF